jgi:ribonuclease HII
MLTAGVDEVGFGCLAGPVVSVAYVVGIKELALLPQNVTDSKKLTPVARSKLYIPLVTAARDIGLGHASPEEIDSLGPVRALQLCYQRALEELHCVPDKLIMDGTNRIECWRGEQIVEPKADFKYKVVSAASIVAKVFRDKLMVELASQFPGYGFENHKGYGTAEHERAIYDRGLLLDGEQYVHRRSYCKKFLHLCPATSVRTG